MAKKNADVKERNVNTDTTGISTQEGIEKIGRFLKHENACFLIKNWYRDGFTLQEIADKIGVPLMSLKKARGIYDELDKALIEGKEVVDYKVQNALLKSALGFKTKEVKVTTLMRYGKIVETQKEVLEKEFAPNLSAIQMWLYNRQKDNWRNMNVQKGLTEELEEDSSIEITVKRASNNESTGTDVQPAEMVADEIDEKEINLRKKSKKEIEKEKKKKQEELAESNQEDWDKIEDEI
jgi:hypothetical protein